MIHIDDSAPTRAFHAVLVHTVLALIVLLTGCGENDRPSPAPQASAATPGDTVDEDASHRVITPDGRLYTNPYGAANGTACSSDSSCQTLICFGLGYHPSPRCAYALGVRSHCYRDRECGFGSNGRHMACWGGYGHRRDRYGRVDNGVCSNQLGPGSSCYRNRECYSNSCSGGRCN